MVITGTFLWPVEVKSKSFFPNPPPSTPDFVLAGKCSTPTDPIMLEEIGREVNVRPIRKFVGKKLNASSV